MQKCKASSKAATFQRVLADALSIQALFQPEPVYSQTGKEFLNTAGVTELRKLKKKSRKKQVCHGTD